MNVSNLVYRKSVAVKVTLIYHNLNGIGLACLKLKCCDMNVSNVPVEVRYGLLRRTDTCRNLTVKERERLTVEVDCRNEVKNATAACVSEGDVKVNGNVLVGGNNKALVTAAANATKTLTAIEALNNGVGEAGLRNECAHIELLCLYFIFIVCIGNNDVGSYNVALTLRSASSLGALGVGALAALCTNALALVLGNGNLTVGFKEEYLIKVGMSAKYSENDLIIACIERNNAKAYGLPIPIRSRAGTCKKSAGNLNSCAVYGNTKLSGYVVIA